MFESVSLNESSNDVKDLIKEFERAFDTKISRAVIHAPGIVDITVDPYTYDRILASDLPKTKIVFGKIDLSLSPNIIMYVMFNNEEYKLIIKRRLVELATNVNGAKPHIDAFMKSAGVKVYEVEEKKSRTHILVRMDMRDFASIRRQQKAITRDLAKTYRVEFNDFKDELDATMVGRDAGAIFTIVPNAQLSESIELNEYTGEPKFKITVSPCLL